MPELKAWNLVADIGGTNARFALHDSGNDELKNILILSVKEHPDFMEAIQHYLSYIRQSSEWNTRPSAICLAVACPVDQDLIRFTNSHWKFSKTELSSVLDNIPLTVINDFTAIAYSITNLTDEEWYPLGGGTAVTGKPVVILGPGTGLGVSTLVPVDGSFRVLDGEGGHIDFAPSSTQEMAILAELKTRFDHVSVERLLSGSGIVNIYQVLCKLQSARVIYQSAQQITSAAMDGKDELAVETVSIFCAVLGSTAANLALISGAKGGVYIAGGIPPKILDFIKHSNCRARFEDKGRFKSYMEQIPLRILLKKQTGLYGAMQKINAMHNPV